MTPLRLTTRVTLALVAIGLVALAAAIGGTAALITRGARAQAVALARFEADEIDRKAKGDPVIAAAVVRIRALASAANRGTGCREAARDRRIFLLDERGRRDGTPGISWPDDRDDPVRMTVPAGAACLERAGEAYGVLRAFPGGRYIVAWIVAADPGLWWRAGLIGSAAFALFAALAGGVAMMFGRAHMDRVRALSAVLDRAESSGFTVRAPRDGLGPELAELADHLDAMIARMGEMTGNLSRLAIHIAHDLRSPLERLHRKLDYLGAQLGQPNATNALEEARAQADSLARRCTQLLEIVRIEAATSDTFVLIDLAAQITLLVDDVFADAAAERGIRIAVDAAPIQVPGMVETVQRMLANLLQNAIAFARAESVIRITLATEPGMARITIDNDGPQVAAERLQAIFEPHVAAAAEAGGGYGLGLPYVRAAARRHGGDVTAEAIVGGMRFTVRLKS